ncbi:hypothetical protein [Lysinibacillus odysseyi]|uniref:Uncharacterized protein n=1 Tax=Lysinibacillus odysseyi 34hs-1 = NBRC 100172 TaxID=1220589 RepID=A0A0A3JNU6_9BACI|nr:hypothetical protein [Lysinibacillus odysseyi]KGR88697.1 hypothetical protein CD32_01120 [Lysinibacillus odysseyi 34hs-1 = NBRC 100172]
MTNKLIERLEELAEEMKVIVHQLRVPSTIQAVEDVIEFDGRQYKKVDRLARVGDYVSVSFENGKCFKPNKIYGPVFNDGGLRVKADSSYGDGLEITLVYNDYYGRTTKTVDVYELHSIPFDSLPDSPLTPNPKSANQQRAEIIEKAKDFIDKHEPSGYSVEVSTIKERIVVVRLIDENYVVKYQGVARCNPSDVFNYYIGHAIALGRAKGLDVSEFENAVQPLEFAVGQNCVISNWAGHNGNKLTITKLLDGKRAYHSYMDGWLGFDTLTIINDTNAEYEVNA